MTTLIDSLLAVLYPPICPCCGDVMTRGESPMCLACRLKLPLTGHEASPADNDLMDKLQGAVKIEKAAAYFRYRRNSPQSALIHDMKYRNCPSIGRQLAREYAATLKAEGFFDDIGAIAPVPLNFWRHCRRGYNQSAAIASGIADVTSLPVIDALKAKAHLSQTRRSAADRQSAVGGVYSPRPQSLSGINHLLLVDDICTTGATLHSCAVALRSASPSLRISVLVLASTTLL